MWFAIVFSGALTLSLAGPALAGCGGDFGGFVADLRAEAGARGFGAPTIDAFFRGAAIDPKVLRADHGQGVFQKTFNDFASAKITSARLARGRAMAQRYAKTFARIQGDYGVSPGVLLSFWAFETDFGGTLGDFNTRNALLTLAHDCRRPDLFRPQIFAALKLAEQGGFDPARTTGAWAGEIGQMQMLPTDLLRYGTDGDGDGRVDVRGSAADALVSAARLLRGYGWRPDEPWLQEITLPATLDWTLTGMNHTLPVADWARRGVRARDGALAAGLDGSILMPMGRKGPAFMAYPNFQVFFDWNKSTVYMTTAAHFAARLEGAAAFDPGAPEPGLTPAGVMALQKKLVARGYDVGKIDGIAGEKTREAVQREQERLGLPADAWPTPALLSRL